MYDVLCDKSTNGAAEVRGLKGACKEAVCQIRMHASCMHRLLVD